MCFHRHQHRSERQKDVERCVVLILSHSSVSLTLSIAWLPSFKAWVNVAPPLSLREPSFGSTFNGNPQLPSLLELKASITTVVEFATVSHSDRFRPSATTAISSDYHFICQRTTSGTRACRRRHFEPDY